MDTTGAALISLNAIAFTLVSFAVFSIRYRGALATNIMSPVVVIYLAHMLAFVIAPLAEYALNPFYPQLPVAPAWTYTTGSLLALAGFIALHIGLWLAGQHRPRPTPLPLSDTASPRFRALLDAGAILLLLAAAYITRDSVIYGLSTPKLIENVRAHFLSHMSGRGHVLLFNFGAFFLLLAAHFIRTARRERWLAIDIAGVLLLVGYNILFTNRMLVASFLAGLLFLAISRASADRKHALVAGYVGALAIVAGVGVGLGLIRFYDTPATAGPLMVVAWFLARTFDMFTMLRHVLPQIDAHYWGTTWIEDIAYTYLPRAIISWKPHIYGMTRLQYDFVPQIPVLNAQGIAAATYPIGLYGETAANFGYLGVPVTLCALGYFMQRIYNSAARMLTSGTVTIAGLVAANLYFFHCVTALGFMRYPGQFVSSVVFQSMQMLVMFLTCHFLATVFFMQRRALRSQD